MRIKPHHKKVTERQSYDNYWKLTVEYTNIHGERFRDTLKLIVSFIDDNKETIDSMDKSITALYRELQNNIASVFSKSDYASVRKSINQFVKLGFIKPKLRSYHRLTKRFLNSSTNKERELIMSEIYYTSATLGSSVTVDRSDTKEINFLLKTLMYHPKKKLTENDVISLMNTDVASVSKGYLDEQELAEKYQYAKLTKFDKKKYNQINYFYKFLSYVPGISLLDRTIQYTEDASEILAGNIDTKRDRTLFRIMKENLKEESKRLYAGKEVCYFTKMQTKGLVASHIWRSEDALREMDVEAAYDYKNALLLEQNVDAYFDKYDLTFDTNGKALFGVQVTEDFIEKYRDNKLDKAVLVSERLVYMQKHNISFEKKLSITQ